MTADCAWMTGSTEVIVENFSFLFADDSPAMFWARTTLLPVAEPAVSLTHTRLRVQALANATYHWSGVLEGADDGK